MAIKGIGLNQLVGKVAIVTGATRGIGRSIAKAYSLEGAHLIVTGRTVSGLESLIEECSSDSSNAFAVQGSVSSKEDVKRVVKTAVTEFGKIDILVNNAGVPGPVKPFQDITDAEWDEVMNTNVKGYFLFAREVMPHMLAQHSGNIINISSGAGEKQERNTPVRSLPYNVSKFAVEGLNHALASHLMGTGINVNAIKPGPTRTTFHASTPPEILQKLGSKFGLLEPELVSPLALYLAALKPGELTGASLTVFEWNKEHNNAAT